VTLKEGDGRAVEVWAAHWSPRKFKVTAEAVWANPPTASEGRLRNAALVSHRLAVVERGGVPMVDKAAAVQAAGGLGVLIVDDGRCEAFDQHCCPGADKSRGEGGWVGGWERRALDTLGGVCPNVPCAL
jgi:hypothetical protein